MNFLIRLLLSGLAVITTAYLLPGVEVSGFLMAVVVALVLGVLNVILRPLLILLTIPVTILTLGLFLLVINALIVMLVSWLLEGFEVRNFGWALLFGIVLTLITSVINWAVKDKESS